MTTDEKIDALLIEWGVLYNAILRGETKKDDWVCDQWSVTIGNMTTDFFTGTGHRKQVMPMPNPPYKRNTLAYEAWAKTAFKPVKPSVASVLHSLMLDASAKDMSFNDWCSDYGYSNDSMKAFKTYQACCEIGEKLRKIFNHAQRETLRELLEDY